MSTKNKKKKDIQYGDVDVAHPSTWDSKDVKVRITTFLDEDLLIHIKNEAKEQGKKYQTYLNERLRELFFNEESVEMRLKNLEKAVFKKQA